MAERTRPKIPQELWQHNGVGVFDLLEGIVADAWSVLAETVTGAPRYGVVHHALPPADGCDWVGISVDSWGMVAGGQFPEYYVGPESRKRAKASFMPMCRLMLRRPCQPMPNADPSDPFPKAEALTAASRALVMDAKALLCVWVPKVEERVAAYSAGGQVQWLPMVPTRGADCHGWDIPFMIEVGCGKCEPPA